MSFCHLHLHTDSSLLDGAIQIDKLIDRVSEIGQKSVAVTDHGLMSAAVKLTKAAIDKGITPIIGVEAYMATGKMTDPAKDSGDNFHLTILAKNEEGYRNLCRLTTLSYAEGFNYRPRLDKETLGRYSEGLIVLSGCVGAELPQLLAYDQKKEAEKLVRWYQKVFGEDFVIEVQVHGGLGGIDHMRVEEAGKVLMQERDLNAALVDIANRHDIAIVATNDAHYLTREDGEPHDALLCLSMGAWKGKPNRMRFPGAEHSAWEFYVKSEQEMRKLSKEKWWQTACSDSQQIADKIKGSVVPLGQSVMPVYQIPEDLGYKVWKSTGVLI